MHKLQCEVLNHRMKHEFIFLKICALLFCLVAAGGMVIAQEIGDITQASYSPAPV